MRPRLMSMTTALAVGVTAAVSIACAAGAYLYSSHFYDTVLQTARESALAQGHLIRTALEHQMIENDRSLIARMIKSFGMEPRVENVMLLDRQGSVQYASAPPRDGAPLRIDSPTCQACHRLPPEQRTSSQVIETREGSLLRTVIPLPNRGACHRCHDPSHRINGVLIVDTDAGAIRAAMNRGTRWMALASGGLALVLVAAVAGVVRLVVLRRLQRFETTARRIAAGDLARRVPVNGSDTIAWLAQEFNTMADTMTALLSDVHSQREQLETVINGIDDGIVVLDLDRKVIAANDAFLRRTTRDRGEVIGTSCHGEGASACGAADCPAQACLASGQGQVRICERRTPAGEVIWEEVHASPIRRPSGAITQIVEVWRDISARRAAEARLAESHRLASLGMLASGFSHELNTPLGTALMCVEGIQRATQVASGGQDDQRHRVEENAAIARDQLLRCRSITQHFLRLSRGQGTSADLVDLATTIAAVTRLIEPTARAHAVSVDLEPIPPGLRIRVNEAELQQVLLNLMLNAIQACESGGKVVVGASGGDPICIRVADDGCGIAPENVKRVFEPFFSGRRGGTGLGLFLSLDFVRHWGGDIRVTSTPGAGSTFDVVLPAAGAGTPLPVLS